MTSIVDTSFSIANLTIDSTWGGTVVVSDSLTISGNLILASGTLGGSGAISVAGSGSQFLEGTLSGTLINTGTIDVTGTGTVAITGTVDGGTVDVGAGTNLILAGSTLNNVTLSGNYQLTGNSLIYIQDNFTLDGTLTLGNSSSYGVLYFESGTNQTLGGSGTVLFSGTNPDDSLALSSGTLTIGSGITVQGQNGYVGYSPAIGGSPSSITVINQGTIQADTSGGTITVDGTGSQNTGSLEAVDGATLLLEGTLTNSATISVDATSVLSLNGTLTGGTISIQAGGQIVGSTLDAVTISGALTLDGNQSIDVEGGLTLSGTLTLGNGSSYGSLNFIIDTSQTLSGSGTVLFSGTNPDDSLALSSGTLTIGSGITVQGQNGYVGYSPAIGGSPSSITVVNQGTVQADVSGGTITFEAGNIENTGTLSAANGGTLSVNGSSFTNTGAVDANTGSTISIGGTIDNSGSVFAPTGAGTVAITGTVDGGTVSVGTGTNLNLANSTLDSVTLSGNYELAGNSFIYIENNLTLDGTLTLGSSSSYGALYFESGTNQTLSGSGTVLFSGTNPDDSLALSIGTLTIGSGITVQGQNGYLGYSSAIGGSPGNVTVINQGTIQADTSGGTITVDGTGSQNTGSLEAVDGATLLLEGTLTNSATISVDATSVLSLNGTLTGGTISIQAGGQIVGSTLDAVTISGALTLDGNQSIDVEGGLTLSGTLTLGNGSSYGLLNFIIDTSQTLSGSGTVLFSGTNPDDSLALSSGTLTIGSGITVQGQNGYVGYSPAIGGSPGNVTVINQGTIQADTSGGTITVDGTGSQNTGSLEAVDGATLLLEGTLTNSATISVDATSVLSLNGTLTGGTISIQAGGQIVGSTLDAVTISGALTLDGNQSIDVEGGLTLSGTLTLGNGSSYGLLNFIIDTSQTLSGSGTVLFSGASAEDSVGTPNGTLTIGSGITIQGQNGYVGYSPYLGGSPSNITVVNQGSIQADVSGGTIYVEGASTTNTGTLDATNGGTLSLQSSNFTPGGVIEADAGSTVTIGGIIDNTGLVFSPTGTGTIAITGTVDGGTVDAGTGTNLVLAGSTLNNVTLSGNYQLTDNSFIYIQNNLTLDGTLTLGDSSSYGVLYFISGGSQTLGGSGTVLFSGTTPNDSLALYGGTLTIGSGITVQGQNGYVGYSSLTGA